jgi:predicted phage-related endonuclease
MGVERIPLSGDRAAWLQTRRDFINASEMPTVCGEASYGSLAQLFAEKKGLRPPQTDNAVLRRGRWGESAAFQALADERPEWRVVRANVHCIDRARRIACTPDGYAQAPDLPGTGLVQAKVVSQMIFRMKWLEDNADIYGPANVPANFRIQVGTELMLNPECPWAVLAVLINGEYEWHFRLFDIERDPVLEDRILFATDAFVKNYLDPGIMPPFEPQRDEALVRALYPQDDGTEIDLTGDNRALVAAEELRETRAALKRMEQQEAALKMELVTKLGAHSYGALANGTRLSWKVQHRKAYPVEASNFRVLKLLQAKA